MLVLVFCLKSCYSENTLLKSMEDFLLLEYIQNLPMAASN